MQVSLPFSLLVCECGCGCTWLRLQMLLQDAGTVRRDRKQTHSSFKNFSAASKAVCNEVVSSGPALVCLQAGGSVVQPDGCGWRAAPSARALPPRPAAGLLLGIPGLRQKFIWQLTAGGKQQAPEVSGLDCLLTTPAARAHYPVCLPTSQGLLLESRRSGSSLHMRGAGACP